MKFLKFWLPVLVWAGVIYSFSSLRVHPSTEIDWQDFAIKKTAHVIEYATFFLLLYRGLINTTTLSKKHAALFALALVAIYGITDEYHQSFTPGREPKLRDVLIDTSGGGFSWFLLWKYLPIAPKQLKTLGKTLQIA